MWTIICALFFFGSLAATLKLSDEISYDKKWWFKLLLILSFVFSVASFGLTFYSMSYYDTLKYRERYKPTIEDVADGYAKIDTTTIIHNGEQHEEYEIVWVGNQKGKREQ